MFEQELVCLHGGAVPRTEGKEHALGRVSLVGGLGLSGHDEPSFTSWQWGRSTGYMRWIIPNT